MVKRIDPCNFEWKFDFKNSNLIPVLELYDNKGNIFKSIEATEFSKFLQEVLKNSQQLTNFMSNPDDDNCDECELKYICPLKKT